MGVLIAALAAKFALTEPPLTVEAGIRQESQLDAASNLSLANVGEMDAFILERLTARENETLLALSNGLFAFPAGSEYWPVAWPNRTDEQRAALAASQLQAAAEVVEKYVLGDLYLKAANREPDLYMPKALFYLGDKMTGRKGDADLALDRVVASVMNMGRDPIPSGTPSNTLKSSLLSRGTVNEDEYRGRDGRWGNRGGPWGTDSEDVYNLDFREGG